MLTEIKEWVRTHRLLCCFIIVYIPYTSITHDGATVAAVGALTWYLRRRGRARKRKATEEQLYQEHWKAKDDRLRIEAPEIAAAWDAHDKNLADIKARFRSRDANRLLAHEHEHWQNGFLLMPPSGPRGWHDSYVFCPPAHRRTRRQEREWWRDNEVLETKVANDIFNRNIGGLTSESRNATQDTKIAVTIRDGGQCQRCGNTDDLQFDHVEAWSKGGSTTVENLQLLCGPCNRRKSNK